MKMTALALVLAAIQLPLSYAGAADKDQPATIPTTLPTTAPAVPTVNKPVIAPGGGEYKEPTRIALKTGTKGATIRYTLDGTLPTPTTGQVYADSFILDHTATLVAVAYKEGFAPSPIASAIFFIGNTFKPGLTTFHIGNSLTGTTHDFGIYAKSAGYKHSYTSFIRGGVLTKRLWENEVTTERLSWEKVYGGVPKIDVFTIQPRDFNIDEEAGYDVKFLNLVRLRSPDVQPWLYIEWRELNRWRWSDLGAVPSSEVKAQWPAMTWEESMAAMLLYGEALQAKLRAIYKEGQPIRVLPSGIAMGWAKNMVDHGKIPGMNPGEYNPIFFGKDSVHPNATGAFLVDCTWFGAFYRQSPEGKVVPINAPLTTDQTKIFEKLAWDVIENYPDCGIYKEGKNPAGNPEMHPAPTAISDITPITLSSSTDGAWFRYTLDGTTPTPTNGYIYCGVISVRPGMTVKAVAFKNGAAPSAVTEATYAIIPGDRELVHDAAQPKAPISFSGKDLDLNPAGLLGQYLRYNGTRLPDSGLWPQQILSVGTPGRTLWASAVIRRETDNDAPAALVLSSQLAAHLDKPDNFEVGYFGKDPDTQAGSNTTRSWGLRVGDKVINSTKAVEANKPALLVVRLDFDKEPAGPIHVSLFVNPPAGAQAPAKPDVIADVPPHFEWRSIGFQAAEDAHTTFDGSHIGESFSSVNKPAR